MLAACTGKRALLLELAHQARNRAAAWEALGYDGAADDWRAAETRYLARAAKLSPTGAS